VNVHSVVASPLGDLHVTRDERGITGLYLPTGRAGRAAQGEFAARRDDAAFDDVRSELAEYFAGERQQFDLPLHPAGTAFQHAVWDALRAIPYAATRAYGAIAATLGVPNAARAVGLANGQNPIPIVVPCHRVIGADGSLTGYGGGLAAKRWLLGHEATHAGLTLV
jgi:methylated-DNA-[protein]-cysteine S-methyltransferase